MPECKCGPYFHPNCDIAEHRQKAFREFYRVPNHARPCQSERLKLSQTRHSSWAFVKEADYGDESEGN